MTKTMEVITDVVRGKHPFHQIDDRTEKPMKHRYERRKIREYLKLGDWGKPSETEDAISESQMPEGSE